METKEIKLSTLGIAAKAGKVVCGTQMVCDAMKDKKIFAVIEASGNSDNTQKRLSDRCAFYKVPLIMCSVDSSELGRAVGKGPSAAVGITDKNLAAAVTANKTRAPEKPDPSTV